MRTGQCEHDEITAPTNGALGGVTCTGITGTAADGALCDLTCDAGFTLSDMPSCEGTAWTTTTATCTSDACGPAQVGCATSGTSCIDAGGVQVLECEAVGPGYFFDAGLGGASSTVAACAAGTYSADRAGVLNTWQLVETSDATATGHTCLGCDAGSYVSDTGSDAVEDCVDCAVGTYAPDDGDAGASNPCVACPSDSSTAAEGSQDVQDCLCNAGFEGTLATDSDSCAACAAGSSKLAAGTDPCVECPAGTADEDSTATSDCTDCSTGQFSAAGATSCTACAAGTFDHDTNAATECQDCAAGSYTLTAGLLSCEACPANSGTGQTTGSDAVSACLCDLGFTGTLVDGTSTCTACPEGTYIDTVGGADQDACIACDTGRFVAATGSTDASACLDVDECLSGPCVNGGACSDSTSDDSLALGGYRCTCEDGYASGTCTYLEIVDDYADACAVGLSTDAGLDAGDGNCAVDVDECTSTPCQNGGDCHEHVSDWECQCATVVNDITGERTSHHGESCEIETDPCEIDEDDCDPINADCAHTGPGRHTCTCHLGWTGDGLSCADIDECGSVPCQNGGVCTESACDPSSAPMGVACNAGTATCVTTVVDACEAATADDATCAAAGACTFTAGADGAPSTCTTSVVAACSSAIADEATCTAAGPCTFTAPDDRPPLDTYRCNCAAGFADGLCAAGWDSYADVAAQYDANCQLDTGGLCNIDMDECLSSPCENSAVCSDSTDAATCIGTSTVLATCTGSDDGTGSACALNAGSTACAVDGGDCAFVPVPTCDLDASTDGSAACPAGCSGSTSADAYRCACTAGYTNGACDYTDFITEYTDECTVTESSASDTLGGNCDVDVDECTSSPCQNDAECTESSVEGTVSIHTYQCTCAAGFANGVCEYSFITEYSDECAVSESSASATLSGNCDVDVDECASSPCLNDAVCSESSVEDTVSDHAYQCTCADGYANGVCEYTFIDEYATECSVQESTASATLAGNCDIDVDECSSSPCVNAAVCEDSTAFTCDLDGATDGTADCPAACTSTPGVDSVAAVAPQDATCTGIPTNVADGFYDAVTGTVTCFDNSCAPTGCSNCPDGCVVTPGVLEVTAVDFVAPTCTSAAVSVSLHAYRCTCVAGYASGTCHYDFITEYTDECSVAESSSNDTLSGNCDMDVGDCASSPCQNGAACTESSVQDDVTLHAYQCTCVPGFANGMCELPFISEYEDECTVAESTTGTAATCVATHVSACAAIGSAGTSVGENCTTDDRCTFNNGGNGDPSDDVCDATTADATCVAESSNGEDACTAAGDCTYVAALDGNCDIDVDECASSPCQNGAVCTESSMDADIGFDAYRCACTAGYTNGACDYTDFITEYTDECTVTESSASDTLGGNCDVDVDECTSSPCQNDAECTESSVEGTVSIHTYQCTCAAGFANGVCEYSFITEYSDECAVSESSASATLSGNCDVDVDECASSPCLNDAQCSDSTDDVQLQPTEYTCVCAQGFVNGQCVPDVGCTTNCLDTYDDQCDISIPTSGSDGNCDVNVDECASSPCQHDGVCVDGAGDFSCTCRDYALGWADLIDQTTITPEWLTGQAGITSTWKTDTDCEVREYTDYRCEPGQEVNSTIQRGGESDTFNCIDCGPGTFSPGGLECVVCPYPDVIIPVDWWCRRRVGINGTVIEEDGPCQRNLACTRCPTGLVPNNMSTACVEPDLGASAEEDSASSTVAAVVPTARVELLVSDDVFTDPEVQAALTSDLVRELAVAMNLDPVDIIVEGLEPYDPNGRRLQDEAWRAPTGGGGTNVQLLFTIRPGAGAGALYTLDDALSTDNHPTKQFLESAGVDTSTFEVGARCPAGKTRTGDDTTCYKCPFPRHTVDRETCVPCPEGQVPTDKGDGCRCGDGYYNQTTGFVNCFSLYETYDTKWATNDKSKQFDTTPNDQCSPCPQGGGPDSCVTCKGGIVRINSGYALGDPEQVASAVPIDAIAGPRPVFQCLIKSQCLGDVGPNVSTPASGAAATYVSWENSIKCSETRLNGQESTCTSRGACIYTPGQVNALAITAAPESCTEPTDDGSGPGDCVASFVTASAADPSLGAANCGTGCVYAAAVDEAPATTFRAESCVGEVPDVEKWCDTGYEGPLCSNCVAGYSRGGIKRESPCFSCPEGVPRWVWAALALTMILIGIAVEYVLSQRGEEEEEDDTRPMANRAVALVIGNGSYDVWPNVDGAPTGSNRVAEALSQYGYRVIHCNNASQDTFEKAVAQYRTAVGEMAAVSVSAKRIKACGVQEDSSAEDVLLKELSELSLKDLRTRAMDDGADAVQLEDLLHNDDPKDATIRFCMERELAKALEELDEGEEADLPARPWQKDEQKQLEEAWAEYLRIDEKFSWDVAENNASDSDWQAHRDNRWTTIADAVSTRDADEVQARVKRIGKSQLLNPPGMNDGEVACMFYYCGHGCQIEGKNYLVPNDSNLNPNSKELISVEDVLQARCGDQETQDRIGETVSGPSIVVLDSARWVAPGSLDKDHRDTFVCPITKDVMENPVYLMGEPTGWRYEKEAVEDYLDGMKEKKAEYRSPMSAKKLFLPNTIPPKVTRKTVLDTTLQHRIVKYRERSTLNQMEPVVENTILVFSARPRQYADREGNLFTKELLELMDGNDAVGMLFTKASIRTLRASEGKQVCWDFNAMTQIGTFCISGKKPLLSKEDDDMPSGEDEEVLSILQQSKDQMKNAKSGRSGSNAGPSITKGACGKPKIFFKAFSANLGKIKPPLKTFVGMTQVLGGMSFAFNIEWPDLFNQIVEYSKALSIDFASILPIGCFRADWTFTGNFYMQIGYPPVVLLIMLVVYKLRQSGLRAQVDPPDKEIQFEHEDLLKSSLGFCFTFVFMIYPAVSQTIFQALISQELSEDNELLRVDFQIDYGSPTHTMVVYVAVFMVLVYPLGFPATIAYTLYSNREGLLIEESPEREQFDPLVGDYKLDCYYWEALEMFRKVVLTGLMIFFSPGSVFQLVFGVLVSAVFLVLSVWIRPFVSRFNNRFKIITDVAIMTTFAIAIMMNSNVDVSQEPGWLGKKVFDMAFTVVNMVLPACVVFAEILAQTETEEEEEVHEYAWLGDEKHGGFKELVLDESPRLKALRYNLESTDLKLLNSKAIDAGVKPASIQDMHSSDHPKNDIIEALMQIAGSEGSGTQGKKGPARKPLGTVAGIFGFVEATKKSFPAEGEFDNPMAGDEDDDSTFDVEKSKVKA